jgi:drug/metabolite transporter (DMT)-like permease
MKRSFIELHFIVILLGFTAILGKLSQVNSLTLVFYRTLIAAIALYILIYFKKQNYKIENPQKYKLLGIGILLGAHWLCFFGSAKTSTVSISLVTFATVSVFTSFLKPFILKEKVSRFEVLIGTVATLAVAMIFGFEAKYHLGIILGLLSAFLAAIFSMYNAKLTFEFESRVISFYEISGACLTMLIGIIFFQPKTGFMLQSNDMLWVGILGLVCTVYPQTQMIELMKKIDIFTVNLSLNLEPIYGIFMAYLIFGEREKMSFAFYIGASILVGLVFLDAYFKHYKKARA